MTWNESYTVPYVPTGPWANGGAPGISAQFLDQLEGWVYNTDGPPVASIAGSTSGTANLYQLPWSLLKIVFIDCENFRNGNAGAQTIALPIIFATRIFFIWTGGSPSISLARSGAAQTVQLNSGLGSPGGTVTAGTIIGENAMGHCDYSVDTVWFNGSQAAVASGGIVLVGI
jgi:hypothetical protein